MDPGDVDPTSARTILVPVEGTFAGNALRLALDLAGPETRVAPFLVGSDFGMDARAVARQELVGKLQAMGIAITDRLVPQVTTAGKAMDAIAAAISHAGLAIIGTKSAGTLEKLKRLVAAKQPHVFVAARFFKQRLETRNFADGQCPPFHSTGHSRRTAHLSRRSTDVAAERASRS